MCEKGQSLRLAIRFARWGEGGCDSRRRSGSRTRTGCGSEGGTSSCPSAEPTIFRVFFGGVGCFGPAPERDGESEKKSQSKPPRQEVVTSARTRGTYGVLAHLDGGLYHGPRGSHGLQATDLALPRRLPRGRPRRGPAANPERGVRRGGPPRASPRPQSPRRDCRHVLLRLSLSLSPSPRKALRRFCTLRRRLSLAPIDRDLPGSAGAEQKRRRRGAGGGGRQRYCN